LVKSALDQVGIATTVTGPLLYAMLGTVGGVVIVGAGGGLIKPMQSRWESMLNNAEMEKDKIKQQVPSSSSAEQQPYPDDPAYGAPAPTAGSRPVQVSPPAPGLDAPTTSFDVQR